MDDLEILTYGHTGRLSFQAALRARKPRKKKKKEQPPSRARAAGSGSGSDEEGRGGVADPVSSETKRTKKRKNEAQGGVICIDDDSSNESFADSNVMDLSDSAKKPCLSPSSRSPSPLPPPLSHGVEPSSRDKKAQRRLKKANDVLCMLKSAATFSSPGGSSIDLNESSDSPCHTVTLRIRCRGRTHKYPIQRTAPLLQVCDKLAAELGVASKQIMLSHKTETLKLSKSPDDAGLTTVDIIDAIVATKPQVSSKRDTSLDDDDRYNSITIKIQSSKKHIVYSLNKSDPLEKAMKAFAAELGVSVSKIAFSFDGEVIRSRQSADDLEMESDDVIDARVL